MVAVYLPERRCDLIAALLRPPRPLRAGEFVKDLMLGPVVWPSDDAKDRTDLNVLIARTRSTFARAGLPRGLVERAPWGGETRIRLAADAAVEIR